MSREPHDYDIRVMAIERGLRARKIRGRDLWEVEHPDGRVSQRIPAAEMMAAMAWDKRRTVVRGEDFGDHRECRWTHETGTRSVAQMWDDLCRVYDSTAPVAVQVRPEVTARLNDEYRHALAVGARTEPTDAAPEMDRAGAS